MNPFNAKGSDEVDEVEHVGEEQFAKFATNEILFLSIY